MSRPQIQSKRILDRGYFKKQQKQRVYKKPYGKPDSNSRIRTRRQAEEVRKPLSKAKAQIPVAEESVEEDMLELDGGECVQNPLMADGYTYTPEEWQFDRILGMWDVTSKDGAQQRLVKVRWCPSVIDANAIK